MSQALIHPHLVHPRTGEPLEAVGIVGGRPVWPIMGGDGSEPDANAGEGDQPGDQDQDQDGDEDKRVQRANREAARYRTQLRDTESRLEAAETAQQETNTVLERLRAAITGDDGSGDDGLDPSEQVQALTSEVEGLRSDNTNLQRALLVHELAEEAGANPVALLDSRRFADDLAGMDGEGDDFRASVLEAMRKAVEQNSAYRAGQGSGRGGAEFDKSGGRERPARKARGLGSAISGHYGA